jgi:hypothetical protein
LVALSPLMDDGRGAAVAQTSSTEVAVLVCTSVVTWVVVRDQVVVMTSVTFSVVVTVVVSC